MPLEELWFFSSIWNMCFLRSPSLKSDISWFLEQQLCPDCSGKGAARKETFKSALSSFEETKLAGRGSGKMSYKHLLMCGSCCVTAAGLGGLSWRPGSLPFLAACQHDIKSLHNLMFYVVYEIGMSRLWVMKCQHHDKPSVNHGGASVLTFSAAETQLDPVSSH